jgi:hypothetical protein
MVHRSGWSLLLALGCGPVISSDDTDAGDGSADDTGTGSSAETSATTSTAGTTTAGTTTAGTTAGTTATTGTTVEPTGCAADYVSGCQSYCAAEITCDPESGIYEDCVNDLCDPGLAAASAECQQAFCEALTCYGVLDCNTLENGSPECETAVAKAEEVCDLGASECIVGESSGGSCEYICDGEVERRMVCEAGSCACYENDVVFAECPIDGVCTDTATISDYAAACCGF